MKDDRTAPSAARDAASVDAATAYARLGQRPSKSAAEAWALELERIWAMTAEERMLRALELHEETEDLLDGIGRAHG